MRDEPHTARKIPLRSAASCVQSPSVSELIQPLGTGDDGLSDRVKALERIMTHMLESSKLYSRYNEQYEATHSMERFTD